MRIAIIGCGSLGLLWATRILKTKYELMLFSRTKEQTNKLNENGITLVNYKNERINYQVRCEKVSYANENSYDIVLITVKQNYLTGLIPVIQSMTHAQSQILFLQNGFGHAEKIRCLFNRPWTYAVITTEGALRRGVNEVCHTGIGDSWIGLYPDNTTSSPHTLIESWTDSLNQLEGIDIKRDDFIQKRMWEKFLINCIINPLTTVYGVRNAELLSSRYKKEIDRIVSEAVLISRENGIIFSKKELEQKVYEVCARTSMNFSSTLQDIQRGVSTEIDYLNGTLIRWGQNVGIDTSFNQKLFDQVKKLEVDNGNQRNGTVLYQ